MGKLAYHQDVAARAHLGAALSSREFAEEYVTTSIRLSLGGHPAVFTTKRTLLSLPCCFGGLGVINPTSI